MTVKVGTGPAHSCPHCGEGMERFIYMGLPLRMCLTDGCHTAFGIGTLAMTYLPVLTDDGEWALMRYRGSYLKALWHWLKGGAA